MEVQTWKIGDVHPYKNNPRNNTAAVKPVANSIKEFGFQQPIVVDKDGVIIVGHTRYKAAKMLKLKEVPVVVAANLTPDQVKAYRVADNSTGEVAVWDIPLLNAEIQGLDYDFADFGLNVAVQQVDGDAEDDDYDRELPEEPTCRVGDIWQLGNHRLMVGDSTDPRYVNALMGSEQADLLVTDPPYNVDYGAKVGFLNDYLDQTDSRTNSVIENDHMDAASFYSFLLAAFQAMNDAMRTGAAIYVFHAESTGLQFRQAYSDAGLKLAQCLIWEKNAFVLGRQDYQWRHEPILYGWKEGAGHYFINDRTQDPVLLDELPDFQSMKKQELLAFIDQMLREYKDQTTVHFEPKPTRNDMHPTMKPVPLIGRLMNNSSRPGWMVGDFFAGSGSTLMAAEQLGRTAFCMELDEKNCDVIIKRWETYTGQKAEKL